MNFGKFFKLNRNLSRIEEGFALYDYMDLPAYFGNSRENLMSPKYPVSMTITSDTVQFRLHYSSYKIGENPALYKYDLEYDEAVKKYPDDSLKMAHMEEAILEIPFNNISTNLSDTIKEIYSTTFPQKSSSGSTGGRFLEQLIKKRYTDDIVDKDNTVESQYNALRETVDSSISYSSLWLMDLLRYSAGKQRIGLYDDNGHVVGFLRKLILDFMFDLKHSDVFQNSVNYQKMYSGLMSDFYFSALIHKCEYYYYRELTVQAIDNGRNSRLVTELYASELFNSENLWVQDIMSVHAEKKFDYTYPGKDHLRNIFERYKFQRWPSWFAAPEEEMRRVCFTMKDDTGHRHICNAETLIDYLQLKNNEDNNIIKKMVESYYSTREIISRWFLFRYDFNDVLHLHLFKHFNISILITFVIPILFSLFTKIKLFDTYIYGLSLLFIIFFGWITFRCYKLRLYVKRRRLALRRLRMRGVSGIVCSRRQKIRKKGKYFFSAIIILILGYVIYYIGTLPPIDSVIQETWLYKKSETVPSWLLVIVLSTVLIYIVIRKRLVARLHLLLPRLVASIALSWITLSVGFDLYVSYFDAPLSWAYIWGIVFIVLIFIMYEINRITPYSSSPLKLFRSIEVLMVSYAISLIVGLFIINYLGAKFLERGGYINEYYTQYVDNDKEPKIHRKNNQSNIDKPQTDSLIDTMWVSYGKAIVFKLDSANAADNDIEGFSKNLTDSLINVVRTEKRSGKEYQYPIAAKISFLGMDLFILRDFLIMFSFIAMFMGIFIQLIIFGGNKQMTEL